MRWLLLTLDTDSLAAERLTLISVQSGRHRDEIVSPLVHPSQCLIPSGQLWRQGDQQFVDSIHERAVNVRIESIHGIQVHELQVSIADGEVWSVQAVQVSRCCGKAATSGYQQGGMRQYPIDSVLSFEDGVHV